MNWNHNWEEHAWVIADSGLVHPSFSATTAHAYSPRSHALPE